MTPTELSRLRKLRDELGLQAAADRLGIHKTSLARLLAGEHVTARTEAIVRGEAHGNAPTTKRRA